jgi:asparagine synthetase B (glutamine-hydrolysing)
MLTVSRTPDSCNDLYVMSWQGNWFASPALRPLVVMLPPADRKIPDATRAYLRAFRTLPYAHPIVGPIRRVHMFQSVTCLMGPAGVTLSEQVTPLSVRPDVATLEDASALVAAALDETSRRVIPLTGARLLLSGGVDSTLLATCRRELSVRHAVTVPSFPEYAIETQYAQEAADLLGVPLERVPADASALQSMLTEAVQQSLQPPNHTQTVLLHAAFRSEPATYVTAQFADALFGFGRSVVGYSAQRLAPLLSVASLLPAPSLLPSRVRSALRVHGALRREGGDPRSWTASYARYLSVDAAERLVGREMLATLSHERYVTTKATYPGPLPAAHDLPMAMGQWLDYVHDDAIAIWSAMAEGVGSRLVAPHHSVALIEAAYRIQMPLRVSGGGEAKPVLRHLLGSRVPGYSLTKKKLASGLPMVRMVREGYPDLTSQALRDEVHAMLPKLDDSDPEWAETTWSVLSAQLWERAVASAASENGLARGAA